MKTINRNPDGSFLKMPRSDSKRVCDCGNYSLLSCWRYGDKRDNCLKKDQRIKNKAAFDNKEIINSREWVDIAEFEGLYKISSDGFILSFSNNNYKLLTISLNKHGYKCVSLYKDNIKYRKTVHRLIAIAFLPNPKNKPCINHKNSIRTDNNLENMEWVTYSENNKHAHRFGFADNSLRAAKKVLNTETGEVYLSGSLAAKSLGMNKHTLTGMLAGYNKNKTKLIWKPID